jgi:chromosomal replication initiation ATPase DnaA
MKQEIFDMYVKEVVKLFKIKRDELFTKNKRRDLADARYLLYYLCAKRPMNIRYIQEYMVANGYNIKHSSIIHGINVIAKRVEEDTDYTYIINDIERCIVL